ncbi:uncharacterized protein LOC116309099 [Actinia tenebrosa]|uniref:Uncharacterized protein LOC116309099 n=1 Tax=Actinia tenebrosa TaxID=6105 RepID=A0A6P8J5W0_ACTTE|nr:uncharacterized protein LOC116309099 [Actinia tenebrosa]
MDGILFFRISLILLIFALGSVTGSIITGFFDEPLDLSCNENNDTKQPIEKLIVILKLSNATDTTTTKFVSYNGTKVCNEDHWLYNICLSQVTSYLTKDDNRAHFVIMNPPPTLNNRETKCVYEYKYSTTEDTPSGGTVRTIKLQGL